MVYLNTKTTNFVIFLRLGMEHFGICYICIAIWYILLQYVVVI
jgi:hypothetical protein